MAKESTEISISEITKQIRKKVFYPVYLFYGDEKFLINEAVDLLIEKNIEEPFRQLNVEKYSCNDFDSEMIINSALSIPMLSEKKIVIARDYQNANESKILMHYLANPSVSTILILIAETIDKRKNVFSKVAANGIIVKSANLKKPEIVEWIKLIVSKNKKTISDEAADILFELKDSSLQEISTEIEKIITYIYGKDNITAEDVLSVTGVSRGANVFEFINAIGRDDKTVAIQIMEQLLSQGVDPIYIIAMLTRHFIILWKVHNLRRIKASQNDIAISIQVNPYFVKEYLTQSEKFSIIRIEKILKAIEEADLNLKSVSIPKRIVIENLVCQLVGKEKEFISANRSNFTIEI